MCLQLLFDARPSLFVIIEQPSGSWAFKQEFMLQLAAALHLSLGFEPLCFDVSGFRRSSRFMGKVSETHSVAWDLGNFFL